jgi:nucleotide-binding universal stress UspA family protein
MTARTRITEAATVTDDQQPAGTDRGRILILLDGSRPSLSALEVAAQMARARQAEVLGVFVEEVSLLRSAGYGFAREVGASSGVVRPLDAAALQTRMRAQAEQIRRALQQALATSGGVQALVHCRGAVAEEVLNLLQPEDLLIMGRVGWSGISGARMGSTARRLAGQAPGEVLLWTESRPRPQCRVVVLLNHDREGNRRALMAAAERARRTHCPLTVLVRGPETGDPAILAELQAELEQWGVPARIRQLPLESPESLLRVLQQERAAELVLSRRGSLFGEQGVDMLSELAMPVTVTP